MIEQSHSEQWLSNVAQTMNRAGLPEEYISRTLVELADHADEQAWSGRDEVQQTPASQLANEFISSYRYGRWYRRIPSWMWVLFPLPLSIFVCLTYYVIGVFSLGVFNEGFDAHHASPMFALCLIGLFAFGKVLTPLVAALVTVFVIRKAHRPRWVFNAAMFGLALVFLFTSTDVTVPNRFVGGSLHLTISEDWIFDTRAWKWQLMQAAVVLAATLFFGLRSRSTSQTTSRSAG